MKWKTYRNNAFKGNSKGKLVNGILVERKHSRPIARGSLGENVLKFLHIVFDNTQFKF